MISEEMYIPPSSIWTGQKVTIMIHLFFLPHCIKWGLCSLFVIRGSCSYCDLCLCSQSLFLWFVVPICVAVLCYVGDFYSLSWFPFVFVIFVHSRLLVLVVLLFFHSQFFHLGCFIFSMLFHSYLFHWNRAAWPS